MKLSAKAVILAGALIVFAVVALKGAAVLIPTGTWVPQTNLSSARANASAALLQDGRVLITGGDSGSGSVASADFFAADGTISAAPPMVNARSKHVAVTLQDGRVLVAGGITAGGSATSTAEIYDPVTNSWTSVGTGMTEARSNATAALLPDGRVIISGGQNGSSISSTIEIFDPVAGSFSSAGTMSSPRTQHAMAVLHDGHIIIIGGSNGTSPVASTDIFDPVAGTISAGPSLAVARFGHSATTLLNGQVVVIGGNNGNADPAQMDLASAELFDPAAGTFTALAANMATPREGHLAILLPNNNNALIVGGTSGGTAVATAELFTPQESSQGVWTYGFGSTASMSTARSTAAGSANQVNAPTSVMQRNGVLMVAGGNDASGNALNSTEAYGYATIQTDQGDYPPGTTVTITGSGWKPGENVNLQLVESPLIDTHGPYTVQADASGNISDSSFVTDANDALIRFTLTAAGQASGFQAQTTFTDAPAPTVTCNPNPVNVGTASTCTATVNNSQGDTINWTHTGSGSFDATSCIIGGSPNFSCLVHYTPSAAGSSLLTATDGAKSGTFTVTTPADLSATKSNNVSGSVTLPTNSWTWKIALANTGFTDATFANGNKVLHDDLPSGLTYGAVSGAPAHLTCSIVSNVLTCTVSSSTVTIAAGGGFTVSFAATDTANTAAAFANPTSGGSCAVDPNNVITEATGSNTACSDTVTVNSATVSTTTTVSSSANPSAFGQSVNFTATVTATSGTPTGKVQFKVDGSNFGTPVSLATGVATSGSISSLSVGNHPVEADYLGDTGFNTSTGNLSGGQNVNKADTSSTVSSSINPSVFSQSVTFTATVGPVAPGSGTPTGTVQFKDGATAIGTPQTLNALGQATFSTSSLAVATHSITAVYSGDSSFNATGADAGSTATALSQVVNKADTSSTVSSSVNPSVFGQSVTFTATVSVVAPGSGTPTGTVQFKDGATAIGSPQALNASGQATFSTSSLAVATHSITAVYSGDGNFNATGADAGSTATALSQVVNKADTSSTVSSSVNPSVFGQSVTFTATVSVVAPGSGTPTGTVQFKDGATAIGSPQALNASGQATFSTSSLAVATHSITAVYSGDGNFNATGADAGSTATALSQVVNKADTSSTVSSSVNPSVFGQSVTFTATVSVVAPGSGTPTGTVQFKDGATAIGSPQALNASGQATFSTSSLAVATHSITAVYSGDGNFNATGADAGSTATALSQVVNKADTSSTASSSVNPSVFGQSVTFTATVSVVAPGSGTPTGTVQFKDGATAIGSPQALNASGQATFSTSSLAVATHSITAVYSGDGNFNATGADAGSTATALSQVVNKADTSSTVSSSVNPSVFGQSVTFTATVSVVAPGSGIPTGTVDFKDGATTIASGVALSGGQATFLTSSLAVATHSITAVYSGDSSFNATGADAGSTATALSQVVNKADTSSTVSSSVNPSVFGQSVTFTATVSVVAPGSGTPTGTVQFKDGATAIGTPQTLNASGQATFSTSSLAVATHSITAVYSGDSSFNATGADAGSTATALSQVVNKADTSSTVSSSVNPSVFGQSVTFTATVSVVAPGSGTPTGTVDFKDGVTTIASGVALSGGQATFSTSSLAVATHSITAVYSGDGNFNATGADAGSTATALSQVVNKADTSSTVSSSVNPSVFGQSVTFTATVSVVAPGSGTPTGTVQFKDGATAIGSPQALNASGQATFSTSSLAVATHSITAVYSGDSSFNATGADAGSTATALSQVVNKADTSSTVSSSVNPSVFGQSVTFTATVSVVAPGSGTPTGTVQFKDGATAIGSPQALNASGQATFSTSSLAVATHSITAVYSGDSSFNATGADAGSTATALSQVVNKADTSSTVSSSVNPSVFGQSVTFTATVTVVAPGSGTPAGTVQFVVDGTNFGSPVALVGGTATSGATSVLPVNGSPHTVTVSYVNSDGNFNNSNGLLTGGQIVKSAPTSTTVSSSANPSTDGQSVTFTATVMNTAGAGVSTATPTGSVQFVVDGTNFGSPVPVAGSGATATAASMSTSTLAVGPHSVKATYTNSDGNFSGGTSPTLTQQVNYGFLGLQSPYMPPPTTFNVKRTMPLKWQYTNSGGAVVNSASANPTVVIQGPYACGGGDSAGDITVNDAGASGYQYDSTTNTWQFNWQIKGNAPGCYDIFIKSQQSGQTNGAFPISVVNQ